MRLRPLALFIVFASVLTFSGQAHALTFLTWDWSYQTIPGEEGTGPGTSSYLGSGTLTTDSTPTAGYYEVISLTGTMNGDNITGILSPDTYPTSSNDNLLAASYPQVTSDGLAFATSDGTDYDIGLSHPVYQMDSDDSGQYGFDIQGNFTASMESVPEPSQYGFFIVLAVAGFVGWRKFSRATL